MAFGVFECDVGDAKRGMRHGKRRDFAARQRRETASGGDRRLTGAGGRIASQPLHPVYPRQDGHNADCRGDGNKAQAAYFVSWRHGLFGH